MHLRLALLPLRSLQSKNGLQYVCLRLPSVNSPKANIRHPGFATSSDAPPPKPKKKSTPLPSWKEKQLESGMDDEFQPMSSEALEAHVANELKQGPQGLDLLEWIKIIDTRIRQFKEDPLPFLHPHVSWDELGMVMHCAKYSEHPVAKYAIHFMSMLLASPANRKSIVQSALGTIVNVFAKAPEESRAAAAIFLGRLVTYADSHTALIKLNVHLAALRMISAKSVPEAVKQAGWIILRNLTQYDVEMPEAEKLVPLLLQSLASADDVTRDGALFTLANIAHQEDVQYHCAIHLGVRFLVPLLENEVSVLADTTTKALALLSFHESNAVEFVLTEGAMDVMKRRIFAVNTPQTQENALMLVAHIACFVQTTHAELRTSGVMRRVVQLLQSDSDSVRFASLWALANYFDATDKIGRKLFLDENLAEQFVPLLKNPNLTGQSVPVALAAISSALWNRPDNARAFHSAKGTPILLKFIQDLELPSLEVQAHAGIALGSILSCEDLFAEMEQMKVLLYYMRLLENTVPELQIKLLEGLILAVENWKVSVELLNAPHRDFLAYLAAGKKTETDETVAALAVDVLTRANEIVSTRSSGLPLAEKLKFVRWTKQIPT